jgi:hypothetical protein
MLQDTLSLCTSQRAWPGTAGGADCDEASALWLLHTSLPAISLY